MASVNQRELVNQILPRLKSSTIKFDIPSIDSIVDNLDEFFADNIVFIKEYKKMIANSTFPLGENLVRKEWKNNCSAMLFANSFLFPKTIPQWACSILMGLYAFNVDDINDDPRTKFEKILKQANAWIYVGTRNDLFGNIVPNVSFDHCQDEIPLMRAMLYDGLNVLVEEAEPVELSALKKSIYAAYTRCLISGVTLRVNRLDSMDNLTLRAFDGAPDGFLILAAYNTGVLWDIIDIDTLTFKVPLLKLVALFCLQISLFNDAIFPGKDKEERGENFSLAKINSLVLVINEGIKMESKKIIQDYPTLIGCVELIKSFICGATLWHGPRGDGRYEKYRQDPEFISQWNKLAVENPCEFTIELHTWAIEVINEEIQKIIDDLLIPPETLIRGFFVIIGNAALKKFLQQKVKLNITMIC